MKAQDLVRCGVRSRPPRAPRPPVLAALVTAMALAASACSSSLADGLGPVMTGTTEAYVRPTSTAPNAPPPAPPPPAAPRGAAPAAPAVGAVPAGGLGPGDRGEQVRALEQRLDQLHFDVGTPDDGFDGMTSFAVVAFQKLTGLPRSGRATPDVLDALGRVQPPPALVPGGEPDRVEIDLPRQVLLLYAAGALAKILPVSTASGKRFCDEGRCRTAVTPAGAFKVEFQIPGWRKSDLGRLFNPVYFHDGIAIHGFGSVPPQPASHGCVRIPMGSATWFPQRVPVGTPVYVLDGRTPVVPGPRSP